jgi:beta-glucosidase
MKIRGTISLAAFLVILIQLLSCSQKGSFTQPDLGSRSVKILTKGGYDFKDLNKNGKLDKYEDWRLSTEERINDLISQMTLEEKVGFMIISQINMTRTSTGFTTDLVEEDAVNTSNLFTGKQLAEQEVNASGTTKGINERHLRHFILRANAPAKTIAEWSNKVQTIAEESRLGIPAIYASNPRNHIAVDNFIGFNVGNTEFTQWPGTLGLAAMNDLALIREFAESAAKEWVAAGIRKGYMYQADLSTEPRWGRIEGTFGEDADLVSAITREIVLGFQGEKLGPHSVALTTKHFPGAGPEMDGFDAHFDYGKNQVYPGNMMDYHLKPFIAAIEAGTSAIMPYYALPHETQYEEVGFAFNKGILTDLLRNKLGFKGIINSDTGPISNMPWGVENLSATERYQKALDAGVDIFSGLADPSKLLETVKSGLVTETRIDESVARLLKEKFDLGLFENPYTDPEKADSIVNNTGFKERADLAFHKSIVLLRNNKSLLPLKPKTKIYFEAYFSNRRGGGDPHNVIIPTENLWDLEFTKSPADADFVVLWITPSGGMFNMQRDVAVTPMKLTLSNNSIDIAYVNRLTSTKPTAVVINFSKPWVISEIDNNKASTLLATFGTTTSALLDVITGKFNPTGKMPFAIPVSQTAAENNKEDVPGNLEPVGYALFKFGDGLSY